MIDGKGRLIESTKEEQQSFNRLLTYYEGKNRIKNQQSCIKNNNYFYGRQYAKSKLDERKARGQVTFKLNRIRRAINAFVGFKTAQKPKFLATPMGVNDEHIASIANNLFNWVDYNSNGMEQIREAVLNGDRDNIGYLFLYRDTLDNDKIKFKALNFSKVVVDPASSDSLFRDSNHIMIKDFIPVSRIKTLYGITISPDQPVWWNDHIAAGEKLTDTNGELWAAEPLFDESNTYVKEYECFTRELTKDPSTGKHRWRIKVTKYIGYTHRYEYYLPASITEYPIIPFYADKSNNAYKNGETFHLTELQDYMNDLANALLDNALLTGDPRTYLSEEMVDGDLQEWQDKHKDTGNQFVIRPGKNMTTPYTVGGTPLPSAFTQLFQMFDADFDLALISKGMMGMDTQGNNPQGMNQIAEKREAAMESMRLSLSHMDSALGLLGRCIIQFCQGYVDPQKTLKYVDGENRAKDFQLARSKGLNPEDEYSVQEYMSSETERGRNIFEVKEEIEKAKNDQRFLSTLNEMYNPVTDVDIDVRVIAGSYSSSHNVHQYYNLLEMKARGIMIDDAEIIKHAPIDDANRVAEKSSTIRSLIGSNEQLTHELDEMKEKLNALLSSERGAKEAVMMEKVKSRTTQMKTKAQNDVNTMKRKAQTDIQFNKSKLTNDINHILELSQERTNNVEVIERLKIIIDNLKNSKEEGAQEVLAGFNIDNFLNQGE